MTTIQIVDVYGGNSAANVTKAINATAGVVVKASEGDVADVRHAAIVAQARKAKKLVGHYHFPWMSHDPVDAANRLFVAVAKPLPGDTLWLDYESNAVYTAAQWLTNSKLRAAWTCAFITAVNKTTGAKCGIYANTSDWADLLGAATAAQKKILLAAPLWIADPNHPMGKPGITQPWVMQQYGSAGGIDRDIFDGDAAKWLLLGVPLPVVKPVAPVVKPVVLPPVVATPIVKPVVPVVSPEAATVAVEPPKPVGKIAALLQRFGF